MKFSLAGVLGFVSFATDDKGPSSPQHAIKVKRMADDKNALVSTGRPMEDDHIDLTRSADPMGDMEVMQSYVLSHMYEGFSKRKIEDIEKVLTVYNRKVLTLEDFLVKACKHMVTDLEVVEDEKSKEIQNLKKKNSSLRKSCEASEARVKEQEEEIDNL
ncbi:hypothetical protein Adt_06493 [Abeliophyllum distichum]|uniref:Uncharacterized protein n=1 Tax=Abeliophyllum distichum TaxID=126358 RepID=A0ABD1V724_9LAMI